MNIINYSNSENILNVIEKSLFDMFSQQEEFGKASLYCSPSMVSKIFGSVEEKLIAAGLITDKESMGTVTGSEVCLDSGKSYTTFTIPFLANIKIFSEDNMKENDITIVTYKTTKLQLS